MALDYKGSLFLGHTVCDKNTRGFSQSVCLDFLGERGGGRLNEFKNTDYHRSHHSLLHTVINDIMPDYLPLYNKARNYSTYLKPS